MTTKQIQWSIGAVFFILGGWAMLAPQSVIDLTFRPEFRSGGRIVPFVVACFGSQAMLSGLFAVASRFTRTTFLAYAVALAPFFVFDVWFTFVDRIFTPLGLLDGVGNIVMLGLCWIGWRRAPAN